MDESNPSDAGRLAPAARRGRDLSDVIVVAGVVAVSLGAGLFHVGAGLIVGGAALILIGTRGHLAARAGGTEA